MHNEISDALQELLQEIYFVNERIMTGDIYNARYAFPILHNPVKKCRKALEAAGASNILLDPFEAGGGWIGLVYSYNYDGHNVTGSQTPRRL